MRANGDEETALELKLTTENDGQIYQSQTLSILKNLAAKAAKGIYNHAGAVKLFMYLAETGAKKYEKNHMTPGTWHTVFTVPIRKLAAEDWATEFETEYNLGNYDHFLPKKYATTATAKSASGRDLKAHEKKPRPHRIGSTSVALEVANEARELTCDMADGCEDEVTHIDNKGFVYCTNHGARRKAGGIPCRKLRPAEIKKLERSQPIRY